MDEKLTEPTQQEVEVDIDPDAKRCIWLNHGFALPQRLTPPPMPSVTPGGLALPLPPGPPVDPAPEMVQVDLRIEILPCLRDQCQFYSERNGWCRIDRALKIYTGELAK